MIKLQTLVVGPVMTNCYIASEDNKECFIVDPGDSAEAIADYIEGSGLNPVAILLTHGHFDHIMAVEPLRKRYEGIRVYACTQEIALFEDTVNNETKSIGHPLIIKDIDYLDDGAVIKLIGHDVRLIHTPGHTIGSCCFYVQDEGILFSGDTLFAGDCGRTDLATGDFRSIIHSIREVLMQLPDETKVYPGHEEDTTIGFERKFNIVMRQGGLYA